jgi:hypothetical protein
VTDVPSLGDSQQLFILAGICHAGLPYAAASRLELHDVPSAFAFPKHGKAVLKHRSYHFVSLSVHKILKMKVMN